jgi:phosphoribosylanthranilate isomerase
MIVKVCGITNLEDALAAVEAGASALGFNFYVHSPRYIAPEQAQSILDRLPTGILKVGVFVNVPGTVVAALVGALGLDLAQLHGEAVEYAQGIRLWRAVRVAPELDLAALDSAPAEALLLDTHSDTLYGGTGRTFDWALARRVRSKIILAGGLDASNVRQAIAAALPAGVDACSKLESLPGRKDHARMRQFIQAALA